MNQGNLSISLVSRTAKASLLMMLFLSACGSPAPVAVTATSTNIPPSLSSDTPAPVPPTSTSTPEPAVPVTSLDEIVGAWLTLCGPRACIFEIFADGTYLTKYGNSPSSGGSVIERGNITLTDGVLHLAATSGSCEDNSNGYYQASLVRMDGKPYILELDATQKDPCADRYDGLARDLKYTGE